MYTVLESIPRDNSRFPKVEWSQSLLEAEFNVILLRVTEDIMYRNEVIDRDLASEYTMREFINPVLIGALRLVLIGALRMALWTMWWFLITSILSSRKRKSLKYHKASSKICCNSEHRKNSSPTCFWISMRQENPARDVFKKPLMSLHSPQHAVR